VKWPQIPYHHFPSDQRQQYQERKVWQVIEESGAELVILARYMQAVTASCAGKLDGRR